MSQAIAQRMSSVKHRELGTQEMFLDCADVNRCVEAVSYRIGGVMGRLDLVRGNGAAVIRVAALGHPSIYPPGPINHDGPGPAGAGNPLVPSGYTPRVCRCCDRADRRPPGGRAPRDEHDHTRRPGAPGRVIAACLQRP